MQLALLQDILWNELNPLQYSDMIIGTPKNLVNIHMGMYIKAMSTFNAHIITINETPRNSNLTPILDICIRPSMRSKLIPFLRKMNIRFVQNLMVNKQIIPYSSLQQSNTDQKRGRPFCTYASIIKMIQFQIPKSRLQLSSNLISKTVF